MYVHESNQNVFQREKQTQKRWFTTNLKPEHLPVIVSQK